MTREELLADIAKGRSVAQRLPLYAAAMSVGLLTYQEIQVAVIEVKAEKPVAKRAAKKTATTKTTTGDDA